MNAKQLRSVAEEINDCSDGDFEKSVMGGWATIADPKMCEKARQSAAHILSAVHEDDDEPITPKSLVACGGNLTPSGAVEFVLPAVDGRCNLLWSETAVRVPSRKWLPEEAIPRNMGEFRILMERCGISSKDVNHD